MLALNDAASVVAMGVPEALAHPLGDEDPTTLDDSDANAVTLVDGDPLGESDPSVVRLCDIDMDAEPLADAAVESEATNVVGTADTDPVADAAGEPV